MLVVITIIGILASMITAAAVVARRRAKIAAVVMEVKQLEMACQAYKEKLGEYPPDFAHIHHPTPKVREAAQSGVLRHLARAFPRFMIPGGTVPDRWNNLRTIVADGWGIDIGLSNDTSPAMQSLPFYAPTFWLGGKPDWLVDNTVGNVTLAYPTTTKVLDTKPISSFSGFSADPTNPFSSSTSRIKPFFEFDPNRSKIGSGSAFRYWPQSASGDMTGGAIVYFRADNSAYAVSYLVAGIPMNTWKFATDNADTVTSLPPTVYPAIDNRLSTAATVTWMNPASFQIFSAGSDTLYATPAANATFYPTSVPDNIGPYLFPSGDNYAPNTYDDITNFSGGTLEDAIP
jgi:type II secretory pathway pseudopilin PulG